MPQDTKTTDAEKVLVFDAKNPGAGDPVYRQTHSGWSSFMNENGVWESSITANNFNRTYSFSVPSSGVGTATAFFAVDDDVQISIDGTEVIVDAQSFRGVRSKQLSLAPGNHIISWTAQNGVGPSGGSGPGALALLIYADTGGVPSGITYTTEDITTVLNYFTPGNRIRANHVNELLDLYADFKSHRHSLTDIKVKDTFGNTGGDQSSSVADETSDTIGTNATPSDVSAGTRITSAQHTLIRDALNSLRIHVHNWGDD
jgi:hypothetical protein